MVLDRWKGFVFTGVLVADALPSSPPKAWYQYGNIASQGQTNASYKSSGFRLKQTTWVAQR